ncbi:DUF3311 domain-containing protein [Crystallibacter degradans]|uniref:DUF3311 domain-containing protein n=1 Tax=Crystallibacter degradans TaxID=2726743 RepID=UPI001472FC11|nr:DUF3311 domain-containing protein [Arthrobacter sp. SF27]NMR29104.1 DUF3311 domain-containing protein [Arthrobacter sp. SF27]
MVGNRWSLIVGMGIPAMAVLLGIPLFSQSANTILGIPMVFAWLFALLPITTLCFWVSWRYLERDAYRRLEGDFK